MSKISDMVVIASCEKSAMPFNNVANIPAQYRRTNKEV